MTGVPTRVVAGRYELTRLLGRGGMGAVWQAHDTLLNRDVAIKEIWFPGTADGPVDPAHPMVRRTLREAQAAARLRHPGIVTIYDVVTNEGRPWIVMELINGRSMAEAIRDHGLLPEQQVAAIGFQVLVALRIAHREGIVHRDVKPANILLSPERVVLTDFGIAAIDDATAITATGQMIGSPAYLAPERIAGTPATGAADLWSLGVTLYTAVTGRPPFAREDTQATIAAILTSRPVAPAHAGRLWPVIKGLLVKDPADRLGAEQAVRLLAGVANPIGGSGTPPAGRSGSRWRRALPRRAGFAADGVPPTLAAPPSTLAVTTAHQLSPGKGQSAGAADARPTVSAGLDSTPLNPVQWTPPAPPAASHVGRLRRSGYSAALKAIVVVLMVVVATLGPFAPRPATVIPMYHGTLFGHVEVVNDVAYSPDGRVLVSAGQDRTILIWDTATGRSIAAREGLSDSVGPLAFSPDGTLLAAGGETAVQLWSATTWQVKYQYRPDVGANFGAMRTIAFSPDGKTLAVGGQEGPVVLLDATTMTERARLDGHQGGTYHVAFSPDGKTLASAGADFRVRLWDAYTGAATGVLSADRDYVVAFSPDGSTIAATGLDGSVRRWDAASRSPLKPLEGWTDNLYNLAFSPDGAWLIGGTTSDLGIPVWHVRTGRLVRTGKIGDGSPLCPRFSPDGGTIVTCNGHQLRTWEAAAFVGG